MANIIQRVKTTSGNALIDYRELENKPVSDASLTISGGFADAKAVGNRLSPLEEVLTDQTTKQITTTNIVKRVNNLETVTSATGNGQGKQLADLKNIIDKNNFSASSNITNRLSSVEKTVGQTASTVTDWSLATNTGWYENSNASAVKNGPLSDASGYSTYGEVVSQKIKTVYLKNSSGLVRRFESYCIGSGWTSWVETTPMTSELTKSDFQKMIDDIQAS